MSTPPAAGNAQRRFRRVARPVAMRLWDIEVVGDERLPVDGPAILCPNHLSFLDSAFLMLTMRRNINFIGKAEYMDSWTTKHLFPALGMIPVDRAGGASASAALDAAAEVLAGGELFGIFPEGTRSRSGTLGKGRTGAARLAMQVGCPIHPVGITGTDEIQPPGAKLPKVRRSCRIEIGRAIDPARYGDRGPQHLAWRSMIDEVMFEIREMTGQTYVHEYHGRPGTPGPAEIGRFTDIADLMRPEPSMLAAVGS